MNTVEKLREITSIPGVSGREEAVRKYIVSNLPDGVDYRIDNIGNLIVEIGSEGTPILLTAHMDEIGFLITGVRKDGGLYFRKIGGIPDEIIPGSYVEVITKTGVIEGVIGFPPPHLKEKPQEKFIDVGTSNEEETRKLGVKPLDFAVFKKHFSILNGKFVATRSLDDRFGCLALLDVLNEVYRKIERKVIFLWTVQEEVGLKGAKAYASRLGEEVIVYSVDSFACCSPSITGDVQIDEGPVLRMVDNSSIASFEEAEIVREIAERKGIPLQIGTTGGGTDGSVFWERNMRMVPITLVIKYLHTQCEYMSLDDYENLVKLLVEILVNR